MNNVLGRDMETMLTAYLTCAIWTEGEELGDSGRIDYLHTDSRIQAFLDCAAFLQDTHPSHAALDEGQLGHDLWLTRNGHGAGFFDRHLEPEVLAQLEAAAAKLGPVDLYAGDDSLLYFSNAH